VKKPNNTIEMKKSFFILYLILLSVLTYSQNGTYRCNAQRFEDSNNPSNNKSHSNEMIITVDINDYTGGFVLVSWPSENTSYKWDILRKINTTVKSEAKGVYTQYEARFNVANVQGTKKVIVVLI